MNNIRSLLSTPVIFSLIFAGSSVGFTFLWLLFSLELTYGTLALIILSLLGLIFALVGLISFTHSIGNYIEEMEVSLKGKQIAVSDFSVQLSSLSKGNATSVHSLNGHFSDAACQEVQASMDRLHSIVSTSLSVSSELNKTVLRSQTSVLSLVDSSRENNELVGKTFGAFEEMMSKVDSVLDNAKESALVAGKSVDIAKKGGDVVHSTMNGMEKIRSQIQETSKRIKRLGESSQEVGDIVSLITEIADQTNILSLNAAIQASMAGDAGRGFAVVADEVQRLSERASVATKQISALVKMIQRDTNQAVVSMEHTTAEVVEGARLAQDAGVALDEIKYVSRSLATLIGSIKDAADAQSATSKVLSRTMDMIQQTSQNASRDTGSAASSIKEAVGLVHDFTAQTRR